MNVCSLGEKNKLIKITCSNFLKNCLLLLYFLKNGGKQVANYDYMMERDAAHIYMRLQLCQLRYGIQLKFDDYDRLRTYLLLMEFESKYRDKSPWIIGFLICASIWSLSANGIPFSWTSEFLDLLGLSRNAIGLSNFILLIMFWSACFFVLPRYMEEKPLWKCSEHELNALLAYIRSNASVQKNERL